jgi:phosphonate ABC transporter permease subunit PhnE
LNDNIPSTRTAWRTLITVLAIAVGVVIYAYGWNTTDISLDEVEDETRQQSLQRAMRELLSPAIFTRDREDRTFATTFQIGCPDGELPDNRIETDGEGYLLVTPPCADVDEIIVVEGHDFPGSAIAQIQLVPESGQRVPFKLAVSGEEDAEVSDESTFDVDSAGGFTVNLKVPRGRGLSGKTHEIAVQTRVPTGWPRLSDTSHTVIEKMIETIFLALMATTLALPVSVALSFVAARNLMRQINLALGIVLVGLILLPIGAYLGSYEYSPPDKALGLIPLEKWGVDSMGLVPLGNWGIDLGNNLWPGLIALPVAVAVFVGISVALNQRELTGLAARGRAILLNLLLIIVLVFVLGALGGIGIFLGEKLQEGLLSNVGNFVGTLGELIDLTISAVAAVAVGLWLSSIGATAASLLLRHVRSPVSNVLGAALGFIAGGILLAATGYIGMQAVLIGILTPVVAAVLGGQCLVLLMEQVGVLPHHEIKGEQDEAEQFARLVLFAAGAVAVFIATALVIDLVRAVVDQRLPVKTLWEIGPIEFENGYIAKSALIGAILGGLAGGLSGTNKDFPLGMAIYNTSRTTLNTLRSIEPLIMGIVFVIWVGVGPFAGVLALTLHSIAALGKLYSEQVENIDSGPIEAIQSTGANRLQTIIYAVVPQIVPPYIAFTMYRWDINVRMSTIIGFVGGGGIGFLLKQQIDLLRYKQAGVAMLAIAVVVSVLDYTSAWIREKIV